MLKALPLAPTALAIAFTLATIVEASSAQEASSQQVSEEVFRDFVDFFVETYGLEAVPPRFLEYVEQADSVDQESPEGVPQEYVDFILKAYGVDDISKVPAKRRELAEKRTIKGCFVGDFTCSLRSSNDPKNIASSEPAMLAYTVNNDGEDSFAAHVAAKAQRDLRFAFLSVEGQWDKDNQQKKEQDNLTLGAALNFEFYRLKPTSSEFAQAQEAVLEADESQRREVADNSLDNFSSLGVNVGVKYNRKGIFGDRTTPTCVADPLQLACGRQYLESLRADVTVTPYIPQFESVNPLDSGSPYFVFSPLAGFFYDTALNEDVVLLSGNPVSGDVFGVLGSASLALRPPGEFKQSFQLLFSGQIIKTLDRAVFRIEDFEETSRLFTATLSYAPDNGFLGVKTEGQLIPSFNITYTNGSDSLRGRQSQDTVVFGFGLKY